MGALVGRQVLITGASRGIGAATALAVAREGGDLVLVARHRDTLEAVAQQARTLGSQVRVATVDLRSEVDAQKVAHQVLDFVTPDILLANAGHSIMRGVLDCVERQDSYTRTIDANFLGNVAFCGPVLAAMAARGSGHFVGVTTASARMPLPEWGAYVASKAAFDAWLRAARPELMDAGINVTTCMPGLVDTDMVRPPDGRPRPVVTAQRVADQLVAAMIHPRAEIAPWWVRPAEVITAVAPHAVARLIWRRIRSAQS